MFYFWKFLNKKEFLFIIVTNILFIIPVLIFLIENGILFFHKVEGENVDIFTTLNIFNKIIIITTIIFYFLIPIINPIILSREVLSKINLIKILIILTITLVFSFFFNYDFTSIHGGGFVHKASYLLFGNYILLYYIFFISLIIFFIIFNNKLKNYLIYFLMILSNIQYTIYNKYYDILVVIIFFLLSDIKIKERFFNNKLNLYYLYFMYSIYYLITIFKINIYKLF